MVRMRQCTTYKPTNRDRGLPVCGVGGDAEAWGKGQPLVREVNRGEGRSKTRGKKPTAVGRME